MFNDISITGITPLDHYPIKSSMKNCKQNIKAFKLYIPCPKPDIESVNDIKVSICINDYKIIKTVLGLKIIVNLIFNLKTIYTSLTEEQSVHSAHWDISFCDFILYQNNFNCTLGSLRPNLFIGIEDLSVCNFDNRSIEISLLYIICSSLNYNSSCSHKDNKEPNCKDTGCKDNKVIYKHDLSKDKECNTTYYYPIDYYDTFNKF